MIVVRALCLKTNERSFGFDSNGRKIMILVTGLVMDILGKINDRSMIKDA